MKKAFRLTQLLSNIAIILIAFMFGFVIVKQYLNPHSTQVSSVAPNTSVNNESPAVKTVPTRVSPVGKTVPLENVNWHENQRTLVLYISTTCRYCNESAAFYRSLLAKAGRNAKFIAVLPQTVTEARQHLKSQELNIEEIFNASLTSIGVSATPTLLLVDQNGVVSDSWRGKLKADKEAEVLAKLSSRL